MRAIYDAEQNALLPSGTPRFANQVAWARFYLSREGYLDSSKRGVWSLTEKGAKTYLSLADSRKIVLNAVKFFAEARKHKAKNIVETQKDEIQDVEPGDHQEAVLDLIRSLPASGFERLAQRLLREAGFKHKGIIITTGTFTAEARKEAIRDGVPPIELVYGQKLVEMLESLELGLKPRTVYEIDGAFFDDFKDRTRN